MKQVLFYLRSVFVVFLLQIGGSALWAQHAYQAPVKEPDLTETAISEHFVGKVFLTSGQIVQGRITFYHNQDMVRVKLADSTGAAFAPFAVKMIQGQDLKNGYSRTFKALPYMYRIGTGTRTIPTYFEELVQGRYGLLMRKLSMPVYDRPEKVPGKQNFQGVPKGIDIPATVDKLAYQFFVQLPKGEIQFLKNPKKELPVLYGANLEQMRKYIKDHKLDYDDPNHLIKIVEHLNSIAVSL